MLKGCDYTMEKKLDDKPITFDHPVKLSDGITLVDGDVTARAYVNEIDGHIKYNIELENKTTGKTTKNDLVIGEIEEDQED